MPFLHRWLGNPMFSLLARRWFRAPVHDIYCGLRGFTRELYERLDQRCTGMEFATEMIIKASLLNARIAKSDHPAPGRPRVHPPHLKTFRDGWRTLRFFLMYSPRWLFLLPGLRLIVLGSIGYARGDAGHDAGGHDVRRAHSSVREPGDHLRLQSVLLRAHREDVCGHRRTAAARFTNRPSHRGRSTLEHGLVAGGHCRGVASSCSSRRSTSGACTISAAELRRNDGLVVPA